MSTPTHVGAAATTTIGIPVGAGAGSSVIDTTISVGVATYLFPGGTTGGVFYKTAPTVTFSDQQDQVIMQQQLQPFKILQ